jgi:hypothetical protein
MLGLLAAACFCLVYLRHALTRHGANPEPFTPLIFVAGFLLPCYLRTANHRLNWPVALAYAPLCAVTAWNQVDPLADRLKAFLQMDWSRARLEITHPVLRDAMPVAQGLKDETLYVWPWETIVNVAAGKTSPGYTLQSYAAHTDRLERATIDRLQAVPDLPVMIFMDGGLDLVENLTRTPRIFRYLLENYALVPPCNRAFLLLRRRPERSREWHEQDLPNMAGNFTPGESQSLRLDLPDDLAKDFSASDLFVLRLTAAPTRSFGIGKPGKLSLTLFLSNGDRRTQPLPLSADGEIHEVLVSACGISEPLFFSFFHPRHCWRACERVIALELTWAPMDLLSRKPKTIALKGISLLRHKGVEFLETELSRQEDKWLWQWCYEDVTPVYHPGDRIDFAKDSSWPYLGNDWHEPEDWGRWSGATGTIRFRLEQVQSLRLRLNARTLGMQKVVIGLNGRDLKAFHGSDESSLTEYDIPKEAVAEDNLLTFTLPDARSPKSVGPSEDFRILGVGINWIEFVPTKED